MRWFFIVAFAFMACGDSSKYSDDSTAVFDSLWNAQDAALPDAEDTAAWRCGGREEDAPE